MNSFDRYYEQIMQQHVAEKTHHRKMARVVGDTVTRPLKNAATGIGNFIKNPFKTTGRVVKGTLDRAGNALDNTVTGIATGDPKKVFRGATGAVGLANPASLAQKAAQDASRKTASSTTTNTPVSTPKSKLRSRPFASKRRPFGR